MEGSVAVQNNDDRYGGPKTYGSVSGSRSPILVKTIPVTNGEV
jgi:hypothetical protein